MPAAVGHRMSPPRLPGRQTTAGTIIRPTRVVCLVTNSLRLQRFSEGEAVAHQPLKFRALALCHPLSVPKSPISGKHTGVPRP